MNLEDCGGFVGYINDIGGESIRPKDPQRVYLTEEENIFLHEYGYIKLLVSPSKEGQTLCITTDGYSTSGEPAGYYVHPSRYFGCLFFNDRSQIARYSLDSVNSLIHYLEAYVCGYIEVFSRPKDHVGLIAWRQAYSPFYFRPYSHSRETVEECLNGQPFKIGKTADYTNGDTPFDLATMALYRLEKEAREKEPQRGWFARLFGSNK